MSDEKLRSDSLDSFIREVSETDAGFGDVAEEERKTEKDVVKNVEEGVGDAPEEEPNEDDEKEVKSEEESIVRQTSPEIGGEEEDEGDEEGEDGDEGGLEDLVFYEGGELEEEGEEEEEQIKKTSSALQPSSASELVVISILEEILEIVVRKAEGIESGTELQDGSEEGKSEDEGEEEEEVELEPSIHTISVTTIKREASLPSEVSEERRILRQAEDGQLKMDREEQLRQETFDENVRLFNHLVKERGELKRKNAYLTRKMYEFYQRHKMEHLFKELPSGNQEMEARYLRALSTYEELKNSADIEDGKVNALIDLLTTRREEVAEVMEEELRTLAAMQREVGDGLRFNYSAKILRDKALDKLLYNQLAKCAEVDQFRVKFFILRDDVSAEESRLKALDDIGESCTMRMYEQLRLHNQGCIEKLEEKDSELEKLRTKALSAMQIFTEVREAAHAAQEDIETEKRTLTDVERDLAQTRERLGSEKKRRDLNRIDTVRLQREAGLISQPKLLKDYKRSKIEHENLKEEMLKLREKAARQQYTLTSMRGTIERISPHK